MNTIDAIRKFIQTESSSGIVLFVAAIAALLLSNSPLALDYEHFFRMPLGFKLGDLTFKKAIHWWINDGLMVIFFLMVTLEIKWEMFRGELSSISSVMLPLIAAIGGMLVPATIYMLINWNNPMVHIGWAIPTATDIAFSLGVLTLLGKRVPISLKIFLSTIAIFDDLGAIVVIAIFYTKNISFSALGFALISALSLLVLNRSRVKTFTPYMIVGLVLWGCLLKSGIHPTLAGVAIAFAIPIGGADEKSPVTKLTHKLHPWVAFFILPLFAFANAGVAFGNLTTDDLVHPLAVGIAAGLFAGKQIGIWGASFLAVKSKLCKLPKNINWIHVYGIALICGIGFTMSLFIGSLAFHRVGRIYEGLVRWGVLSGSFISGILGYAFLRFSLKSPPPLEKKK